VGLEWVTPLYKTGAAAFRALPRPVSEGVASTAYRAVSRLSAERRLLVARNLKRINGDDFDGAELASAVRRTFESYGRYWVDSFRLPKLTDAEIDFGFSYEGVEHVARQLATGRGAINVLPHLGGWEWAAFWLARIMRWPVTAVVEPLEPPELFEFFVEFRRGLGMEVVPLGPDAGTAVLRAISQGHLVALLCDRDLEGNGVEVDFLGERTTLPAGPATLALRTGAPLLPTAVYFRGGGHYSIVRPPLDVQRREKRLRQDVQRVTQQIADALGELIALAPEQWHLQQPNWPSDWDALEAIGRQYPRPGEKRAAGKGEGEPDGAGGRTSTR
jgi:KDO2-lipid IV(A) lauroyltransferase